MSHKARGAKCNRHCEGCGKPFQARTADVARGWGRFCSKTCKAKKQEQRLPVHASEDINWVHPLEWDHE